MKSRTRSDAPSSDIQSLEKTRQISNLLLSWLEKRLESEAAHKIRTAAERMKGPAEDWELFSSFSSIFRHTGKDPIQLESEERDDAESLRSGWNPETWTMDQLGRILLVLHLTERGREIFLEIFEKMFISSDLGEAEALYRSLPLLPWPEELQKRAAEGIRSNITQLFHAVALDNPFPADYLQDEAWNQMVLKALFTDTPLYRIQNVDQRANANLARMLVEYAHERWSAGRSVSPELWRPVGPFIDVSNLNEIQRVLSHPDQLQKQAAILALEASDSVEAKQLLSEEKDQTTSIQRISWNEIGARLEQKQMRKE